MCIHVFQTSRGVYVFTNQPCILERSLSHMGTKNPSSNWPTEIFTKLFTSADVHTLMGSSRANQCSAPTAVCMVSSFRLSIFYPQIHPSLSAPSVPLLESGTPIPGTEPQHSQKHTTTFTHTDTHTLALIFCYLHFTLNRTKGVDFFKYIFIIYCVSVCPSVCICVCSWVDSHPEQPLHCLENKACLKLS